MCIEAYRLHYEINYTLFNTSEHILDIIEVENEYNYS